MKRERRFLIWAVLGLCLIAGCSHADEIEVVCLDSVDQEYVVDHIDEKQEFVLSQYRKDIRMMKADGEEVPIQVSEKGGKDVILAPEEGYQADTVYVLELNGSQLEDEKLKEANKVYFSVDMIENKEMQITDCIIDDPITTYQGKSYIEKPTFVFTNPQLHIQKEIDQFSSLQMTIEGETYPYSEGMLPVQPTEGAYTVDFALEYGDQTFHYSETLNFKTATLLDLYGQQELLTVGKEKFINNYSMLYGLAYGAIFDIDESEVVDANGQPFALAADPNIQTVEGFENYYYSIYSRKYPMVEIRMHQQNGKVYFPVAYGIGGPMIDSIEVTDIQNASEDEVWYTVHIEYPYGEPEDFTYSLVLEDGQWKFGIIKIPFMHYRPYV